ncbi:SAM-dependent chlorinase/fluorinase [Fortiea sp. LEGE XX443]|uniref:SAM hydrolase/SAM-dependent halogenase family protein n=1 Tax=Fortiea sp. LEGE XX443 TaxID=1828611 RepID=UPI00187F27CF|nr:S-adenosyl-l-methionine hydroxide adenosyltransferase family protein [Fortiea sp. LEGE XX443]MBE9006904.1 SAM-dependent chlorinase/fluorinase [Fortiea sp. LEGE XX443]
MVESQTTQRSLLTLLSDFGDRDVYVGVMKGIIAKINPMLRVVDLTHQIPPQNIAAARFCLINAYPYFPDGTVHVAVVDPGVGSKRRAIAVEFADGFLVGPDNGIFSGVLNQTPAITAVELTNSAYWLTPHPSSTFHGRDIFASVGANLASGVSVKQLGTEINPASLLQLDIGNYKETTTGILGCIQYIDHFGNLISNIPGNYVQNQTWCVQAAGLTIPGCKTYSDVKLGEAIALVGSHGWVEIAINGGNAHLQLQINWQDALEVIMLLD